MKFQELAQQMGVDPNQRVLAFDPGHTTGYAYFEGDKLEECGEIDTSNMQSAVKEIDLIIGAHSPEVIVMEDYRIYKWRAKHHAGSEVLTIQVIGAIQTIAIQESIYDIIKQPAHTAKGFCTDGKLREWGFYQTGNKHANDAVRHGTYYILFGPIQKKDKDRSTVG
jgi:hypothetical protein